MIWCACAIWCVCFHIQIYHFCWIKELKINRISKAITFSFILPNESFCMRNFWWKQNVMRTQCRMIVLQRKKRTPKSVHRRIGGCESKNVEEERNKWIAIQPQTHAQAQAHTLCSHIIQTQLSWFIFDFKCFHCLFIRLFLAHLHIKLFSSILQISNSTRISMPFEAPCKF